MITVIEEKNFKGTKLLFLNAEPPRMPYYFYLIDGKKYTPVPVSNMKTCIAVEEEEANSLVGKSVDFV